MEIVSICFIIVALSVLSFEDVRHKKVRMLHFLYMCPIAIITALLSILYEKISIYEIGLGLGMVGAIAIVAKVSKGLGMADVITMLMVGIVCGGERLFLGITISLLLVYGLAIIMMFRRKLNKHTTFPYIPFLNIGMLCVILQGF